VEEHPPGAGRIVQPSEQTLPEPNKVEKCEEKPNKLKAEEKPDKENEQKVEKPVEAKLS
jgi:hypothetical protein